MTRSPVRPVNDESLAEACALLRAGRLCAFPTETVYGLGADARSAAAVERIYAAKGRPAENPLIVHVPDAAAARALAAGWPARADELAARFWPGPLTLVVPRGRAIPAVVSAGLATVALRVPAHPVAQRLLCACGLPLAAPSANRSERLSPTTAEHVRRGLPDLPLILDGGPCRLGIESTVVDLTCAPPRLLRPGALPLTALQPLLPDLRLPALAEAADDVPRAAPGMMTRHYAPRARLLLYRRPGEIDPARLAAPVGLLLQRAGDAPDLGPHPPAALELLPDDAPGYGADLYAALHRLDDAGVATILVRLPEPAVDDEAWLAVHDRLKRASAT